MGSRGTDDLRRFLRPRRELSSMARPRRTTTVSTKETRPVSGTISPETHFTRAAREKPEPELESTHVKTRTLAEKCKNDCNVFI
jgi:hypothetical protein